jgi:hypothetical protein
MARGEAARWNSGVASLLDEEHYPVVVEIWKDLEKEFGLREAMFSPWPHLSYQLGDYDEEAVGEILERVAAARQPFTVQSSGLGVFTGSEPIVYIPIVRTAELSEWHRTVWTAVGTACRNAADHYWLTDWIPHITLAAGDLKRTDIAAVVGHLAARSFEWEMTIDNIAFIDAGYEGQELKVHYELTG